MKTALLLFFLFSGSISLYAQQCQEVEIATTPQQRELLTAYINDCYQKHYFFEDKGVVQLVVYRDAEERLCWYLSAQIDTRYRSSPPKQYAQFGNNIILVYQGDKIGRPLLTTENIAALNDCIGEVLGGRVYEYAPKPQHIYMKEANGSKTKMPVTYELTGNHHNYLIIKFNKDDTINKVIPA